MFIILIPLFRSRTPRQATLSSSSAPDNSASVAVSGEAQDSEEPVAVSGKAPDADLAPGEATVAVSGEATVALSGEATVAL